MMTRYARVLLLALVFSASLVSVIASVPERVFAQTCAGGCDPNYSCVYNEKNVPACLQDCPGGVARDAFGACPVEELVITASKRTGPTFADFVNTLVGFVDTYVMPLLYSLAFLFFIFGMFRYFFTGGEENREKGKAFALWAIIGMVVLFSVWGLVNLLLTALPK